MQNTNLGHATQKETGPKARPYEFAFLQRFAKNLRHPLFAKRSNINEMVVRFPPNLILV